MLQDPSFASVTELIAEYAARRTSPIEITERALAAIDRLDPALNAFRLVDRDAAFAAARTADARWRIGAPLGPLDGVPVSIKDLLDVQGWPTRKGSRLTKPDALAADSPAVARLRESGAVLLGKTNTAEFGWKGVTDSPLAGITRNPWQTALTPGGSSGGASAALAAGMGTLALCTDGGGSIRNPAAFTNLCGLKATFGRVPFWPASPMGTLSNAGPMARRVADLALMLNVIARPDARDGLSMRYDARDWCADLRDGVAGLRIAYSPALGFAKVHPEVAAAVESGAHRVATLGAQVAEVDPPIGDVASIFNMHWTASVAAAFGDAPDAALDALDPGLRDTAIRGRSLRLADYIAAQNARIELGHRMRVFHESFDLLVLPTVATPAFPVERRAPPGVDEDDLAGWSPFSYPFNLTMQPALTVPCGFTKGGLPIGIQFVAAMYREDLVLRAGWAFEQSLPLYDRRPALAAP